MGAVLMKVPTESSLHSHFSSRSPARQFLPGTAQWSHVVAVDQAPALIPAIGHICKYSDVTFV